MKYLFVGVILIMTVFAVMVFLLGFPVIMEGVGSANTSASVNVTNYEGWTATVNSAPWLMFAILLFLGGAFVYSVIKRG